MGYVFCLSRVKGAMPARNHTCFCKFQLPFFIRLLNFFKVQTPAHEYIYIYIYILLFLLQVLTSSIFGLIMCRKLDTQLLARPYLRVLFMFCSYIVINMVIYFLSSSAMYGKFNIFNPTLTLLIKYHPFNGLKNNYLGFI